MRSSNKLEAELSVIVRRVVREVLNHGDSTPKGWLSEGDLPAYTSLSISFFRKLRRAGQGPYFIRVNGNRILYKRTDIDQWLEERGGNSG
jgi:hypothetical protein